VVRGMDERAAMAVALVENIQRADLNPLEESAALHKLIDECGLTHEKCAEAVGRSRAHVSNLLRLMELNEDVRSRVRDGQVSLGHAKVLLGVHGARQSALAERVAEQHLSVRALEALIHAEGGTKEKAARPAVSRLEHDLSQRIGLPVRVQQNAQGRGRLTVAFKGKDELDRLLKIIR
jgi:ParB family transcriptional regulator, chromosome partitioning protein